jgi:gluconate kinase
MDIIYSISIVVSPALVLTQQPVNERVIHMDIFDSVIVFIKYLDMIYNVDMQRLLQPKNHFMHQTLIASHL